MKIHNGRQPCIYILYNYIMLNHYYFCGTVLIENFPSNVIGVYLLSCQFWSERGNGDLERYFYISNNELNQIQHQYTIYQYTVYADKSMPLAQI